MRALLLWADDASANLGVRVLAAGTTGLLRQRWPNAEVDCYLRPFPDGPAPIHLGYRALLEGIASRSTSASRWFQSYDLVVDTGGGDSFADIYGRDRLSLITALRLCAARSGTPVVLGPQTIGPFTTKTGKAMARVSLLGTRSVVARDSASQAYARESLGRHVELSSDVVFALPVDVAQRPESDVLFNVSGLLWQTNPHVDAPAYRELCRDSVRGLAAAGYRVRLLSHVLGNNTGDEDEQACRALADELAELSLDVVVPVDLDDVRAHIAASRVVVGARMHACLNALSLGIPAVPLAYSRKFAPLMQDLQWGHALEIGSSATSDAVVSGVQSLMGSHEAGAVAARAREKLAVTLESIARLVER